MPDFLNQLSYCQSAWQKLELNKTGPIRTGSGG